MMMTLMLSRRVWPLFNAHRWSILLATLNTFLPAGLVLSCCDYLRR